MNFKMIAAAAALLAAGAANAALTSMNGAGSFGDSSVVLVKLDSTGSTTQGLVVDLGFNFSNFINGGSLSGANQKVEWDFANNTIKVNGNLVTGVTNDWASQFSTFAANSDAADTKWAILAGSQNGSSANAFLTSGTPTTANLNAQTGVNTFKFTQTNALFTTNASQGTLASADNGAYAMASTDAGYVGKNTIFGGTTANGWQAALVKWSAWSVDGAATNLEYVTPKQSNSTSGKNYFVADSSTYALGANEALDTTGLLNGYGTFTLTGTSLVYQTASITTSAATVPEPESYALALAGLAALAVVRRRAAK